MAWPCVRCWPRRPRISYGRARGRGPLARQFRADAGEIRALARRHLRYGVLEQHYASVGEALLWTLEQGLRTDFTDEVRCAWTKAYDILSSTMIEAAYPRSTIAEHA